MTQIAVLDILAEVRQICRECPESTMVMAYVRAARRLCNKSRWLVVTLPGSTVVGQRIYTLGSDTYNEIIGIKALAVEDPPGRVEPLTEADSGTWDTTQASGVPDFYSYIPEGQFALHPMADKVYPLVASLAVQPKRGAVTIDDSLVVSWDYALQAGALAYLLALPRTPWTDPAGAQVQEGIFRSGMNQATSSAMRGYNAGAAPGAMYGNPSGALRTRILPI